MFSESIRYFKRLRKINNIHIEFLAIILYGVNRIRNVTFIVCKREKGKNEKKNRSRGRVEVEVGKWGERKLSSLVLLPNCLQWPHLKVKVRRLEKNPVSQQEFNYMSPIVCCLPEFMLEVGVSSQSWDAKPENLTLDSIILTGTPSTYP